MKKTAAAASALAWACLLICASVSDGAVVSWMNLGQLYRSAGTVFSGQCIEVERCYDARARGEVNAYRFRAERFFKGDERRIVSFKVHRIASRYAGAPSFVRGERAVLFLYPESGLGVTAPVGLGQGTFSVLGAPERDGRVVNGRNNRFLFRGMRLSAYVPQIASRFGSEAVRPLKSASPGSIRYDVFSALLEAIGRGGDW